MAKKVLVLTSGYPFGGEPFLHTEQLYAPEATMFFSLDGSKGPKDNIGNKKAYYVETKKSKFGLLKYLFKGIFDHEFWHELRYMFDNKKLSFKSLLRMVGFYCGATRCYEQVCKVLDNENIRDISVIYSYWMSYHAFVAVKMREKFPSAKIITRCHGYDIYEYRSYKEYMPFRDFILNGEDMICPISSDGLEYIRTKYGDKIFKKSKLFRLGTIGPETVAIHAKSKGFCIVTCSNLVEVKRVDKTIDALSNLDIANAKWIHFGDGPLKEQLLKMANEKLKNIAFEFKGYVDNDTLKTIYASTSIDLFLNTSESEGIPVSIMEAMSFGIPVIATNVGGTPEIVENGYNGFLLDKNFNPNQLSEKIIEFYRYDNKTIEDLKLNAFNTWNDNYNAKINYKQFYDYIEGNI